MEPLSLRIEEAPDGSYTLVNQSWINFSKKNYRNFAELREAFFEIIEEREEYKIAEVVVELNRQQMEERISQGKETAA